MDAININQKKGFAQEHFLGISIILAFLLPHTNTLFLLINPVLCLLCLFFFKDRQWKPFVLIVLVPIIISLVLNFQDAATKSFLSTFTITLYFTFFPFVGKVRVRNSYVFICLIYIIVSQIVYLVNIPFLANFYDRYYPILDENYLRMYEYMQSNISLETVLDYRLGGLFHNSNQCSRYLTMLLAFYISVNYKNTTKNLMPFVIVCYLGILLTGSRTGFVIGSLIVYFGFLRNHRISGYIRSIFFFLMLIGIVFYISRGISYRGLEMGEGLDVSLNSKWRTFLYYLQTEDNTLAFLFGHLDVSTFSSGSGDVMNNFDSEYGSIIYRFGFVGFFCILFFYYQVIKRTTKTHWFFFIILLWIISSTIVASFRALFIFMLLTSVVYSNNKVKIGSISDN